MKDFNLYLATGTKQYLEFLLILNYKNILVSYAYPEPWKMKNVIKRNNVKLLCDSGAFTSWNLSQKKRREDAQLMYLKNNNLDIPEDVKDLILAKEKFHLSPKVEQVEIYKEIDKIGSWKKRLIDIDGYVEHLEKYKDIIYRAVNLDVIPGEQGTAPTEEDVINAAEEGWNNYKYIKGKGFDTIHVYHQGEPLWVLDRMLNECDYIGISPNNDSSEQAKYVWMDHTFRHILNSKNPKIKTHGFAVTSPTLIKRYPWFSVDSSTFSMTAALGTVLTPFGRFYISEQDGKNNIHGKPQELKDKINTYLMKKIGYNLNSMTEKYEDLEATCRGCGDVILTKAKIQNYKSRCFANIIYYSELEDKRNELGCPLDFMKQHTLI